MRAHRRGFTLVELLVVAAIILILIAFLVPAAAKMTRASSLSAASEHLVSAVNLARQTAATQNRNVAMRFYDRGSTGAPSYRSMQLWVQTAPGSPTGAWKALGKEEQFATGLVIDPDPKFSPLLTVATGSDPATGSYSEVIFDPSGRARLPVAKNFLTMREEFASASGGIVAGLPPNFFVLRIEPFNSRPAVFRP